ASSCIVPRGSRFVSLHPVWGKHGHCVCDCGAQLFSAPEIPRLCVRRPDGCLRSQSQRKLSRPCQRSGLAPLPAIQVVAVASRHCWGMCSAAWTHAVLRPASEEVCEVAPCSWPLLHWRRVRGGTSRLLYPILPGTIRRDA